ncbi:MAG: tetratricopeptide repeat protein [Gammaproteobacteria bacterium]|nr:tetratricopeptide repeat protein [Gammaproteobacteria bacterium]
MNQPQPSPAWGAGPALFWLAIALSILAYLRALGFAFVYDDLPQILDTPLIRSFESWPAFFTQDIWAHKSADPTGTYYRPLYLLWLATNYQFFGIDPMGWHATSIFVHALVTGLVYHFARAVGATSATASIAALLFAVHPIHVESVAWISAIVDPLCGLFMLAAAICHQRARDAKRTSQQVLLGAGALVACSLALLSKEIGATFPFFIFALELLRERPNGGLRPVKRLVQASLFALPYALLVVGYLTVRVSVIGSVAHNAAGIGVFESLLSTPAVVLHYLRLFVFPVGLSAEYGLRVIRSATDPSFIWSSVGCLAVLAGLIIFYVKQRSARGIIGVSAAWAVVSVGPALILWMLQPDSFVHDRYLYISSVGLCIATAVMFQALPSGRFVAFGRPAGPIVTTATVITLFAILTVYQSAYWRNGLTLFQRAATQAPHVAHAQTNFGVELLRAGKLDRAEAVFRQVLDTDADNWFATYGTGQAYLFRGEPKKAVGYLERAVKLLPHRADQYLHLGFAHRAARSATRAEAAFREAIRRQPSGLKQHFGLAMSLLDQGRLTEALKAFEAEVALNPSQADAHRYIDALRERLSPKPPSVEDQ